jgi:hypothetical protein
VVRRVLAKHYRPIGGYRGDGPSCLTVIGHAKDSLGSIDLFRCESILWLANSQAEQIHNRFSFCQLPSR